MDDSSRVGNVTTSTGISSSNSRDGSRGSSKGGEGGGGGDVGVAGSDRGDSSNRSHSSSNRGNGSHSRGSVAKTGITVAQSSVAKTSISKTISTVEGISLSLPLGDMDDSSRVGNVTSGTSVGSTDSRDSGRGKASNVHGGRGGNASVASSGNGRSSIAKTGIAVAKSGIAESSVAQTVGTIEGISISLSLPLGNMDNSGRVGNIASSTGIGSSNSGDSSRGKSGNVHRGRRRDTSVASSVGGSIASVSGVAKAISGITCIAEASAIAKEVGVSLGSGCSSKEESGLGSKTQ